jgi:hypothetical protein
MIKKTVPKTVRRGRNPVRNPARKPEREVLPATLANLRTLSKRSQEMLFQCLKLNYEEGGDGTVAIDHDTKEIFIPGAKTVSGNGVEVLRLKPNLVKEFAEVIEEMKAGDE